MKKSLIAAAVVAALPAFAQAQTNVTMYGIVDASVNGIDLGDGARTAMSVGHGSMSTSRWGVRGSEDLGGGLKAVFQLEAGIANDTGAHDSAFFQRTAQVGLQGGFGTVKLGRGYTPAFRMAGTWDALNYGNFNNLLTATVPQSAGGADTATTRFSNGIYYDSPSFGGVKVMAAYAAGESYNELNPSSAGEGLDIAVGYTGGPLNVGAYYQQTTNATGDDTQRYGVGGGYQFGAFKLLASYMVSELDVTGAEEYSAASIGGVMSLGTGSLHAQVIQLTNDNVNDGDALAVALAYRYPMSKRTTLYAQVGTTRNDDNGTFGMRTGAESYVPLQAGSDVVGYGVGIRHVF
ncbi:MAG: porin [Burkholderiaceae bacterium]